MKIPLRSTHVDATASGSVISSLVHIDNPMKDWGQPTYVHAVSSVRILLGYHGTECRTSCARRDPLRSVGAMGRGGRGTYRDHQCGVSTQTIRNLDRKARPGQQAAAWLHTKNHVSTAMRQSEATNSPRVEAIRSYLCQVCSNLKKRKHVFPSPFPICSITVCFEDSGRKQV